MQTIDILRACEKHIPDTFIRDNLDSGGFINLCRGERKITDPSDDKEYTIPGETLLALPKGEIGELPVFEERKKIKPRQGIVSMNYERMDEGLEYTYYKLRTRTGWRDELAALKQKVTHAQFRAILKELGITTPV